MPAPPPPAGQMPRQIPFIIANEACERFSFYGMRNILTTFLAAAFFSHLTKDDAKGQAKDIFHVFVIGVYFFPLIGGWLSDRFFGKYRTILFVSLLYCVGHALLAIFEDEPNGFYLGLMLIAIGAGGIKPLVSTFMGDQFDQTNKVKAKLAFEMFYWSVNFGSFFASLFMPRLLRGDGPANWWGLTPASVAFGIPGILMGIAVIAFWLGRKRYVIVPPAPPDPNAFSRVVRTALLARGGAVPSAHVVGGGPMTPAGRPGLMLAIGGLTVGVVALVAWPLSTSFGGKDIVMALCMALVAILVGLGGGAWLQLERARGVHPDEAVDGVRGVLRVLVIFALVTPFWSLFDQKASTWVFQGELMSKPGWFEPAMMQALNPALVLILIPLNNLVVFPALKRAGYDFSPLRRMGLGIALAGASWVVAGLLQVTLDGGTKLSIVWQILPYLLLTAGEVLVSATGLEFAYSQAPKSMKGVIMSFWSLAVTVGNLWVLLVDETLKTKPVISAVADTGLSITAFLMFFFALFAFAAAAAFVAVARRYRMVDNYRQA
jgi:POT family proton-dependent oligopeptide transporter